MNSTSSHLILNAKQSNTNLLDTQSSNTPYSGFGFFVGGVLN